MLQTVDVRKKLIDFCEHQQAKNNGGSISM
jgi:hypothetical protein